MSVERSTYVRNLLMSQSEIKAHSRALSYQRWDSEVGSAENRVLITIGTNKTEGSSD